MSSRSLNPPLETMRSIGKPHMLVTVTALMLCIGWQPAVQAQDGGNNAFDNAVRTFQYQDYGRAQKLFQELLYPDVVLEEVDQIRDAREYLGAAEWFLGNQEAARQEFTSLLINWSNHELDPFYYPPDLISFFESLRLELVQLKLIKDRPKPKPEEEEDGNEGAVYEKETVNIQSPVMPWIPFGVGQFANGDVSLGTTFLILESGLLATAITSYYLILNNAVDAPDEGQSLYTTFWVSQGLFVALAATGIIEANLRFEGTTSTIERREDGEEASGTNSLWAPTIQWDNEGSARFGFQGTF